MKVLGSAAFAALVLMMMSSDASAWYCRAYGNGGSGWGRSDSASRARYLALYECEKVASYCRIRSCIP